MRLSWLVLTAAFVSSALGQPCSPIRFNVLPIRSIAQVSNPVTGSGVVRQADGSLVQHAYLRLRPGLELSSFAKGAVTPDLAGELFACSGQTLQQAAPAAIGKPFAPLTGVSSTEILVTNLTGDQRPAILLFNRFDAPDALIVGIVDESYMPQSTATYPVGPNPINSLAGDFNADGHTDVAVVFRGQFGMNNGGVSILLGKGDGTLEEAVNYVTGEAPSVATAARFNGDDTLDIAVAHTNKQEIKLLMGQAGGAFGTPTTLPVSGFPSALAVAKINGDGFNDLVYNADGGAKVMLGNEAGGFGAELHVDGGLQPVAIAAGDLNKDGKTDLAFGDTSGGLLATVLGDGAGGFGPPKRYAGGNWPGAIFISDFDLDGNADVVTATGHPDAYTWLPTGAAIAVLRGKGDGSFFGSESIFGGNIGAAVVTADFNGDERDDLAVSRRGGVAVALGRGDGTFQPPMTIGIQQISGVGRPQQIATGDLNNDEIPDLVVVTASGSSGSDKVFSLLGKGDGTFHSPVATTTVREPEAVMTGDLNGDDRDDVVVLGSNGFTNEHGYAVHLIDSNGLPGAAQKVLFETTVRPRALALGDANTDMALDLFILDAGGPEGSKGGLVMLLGNGTGGFGSATMVAAGEGPRSVEAVDVNGDSKLDLLVTTGIPDTFDAQLLTFEGNGNGTFQAPESTPVEFGPGEMLLEDFSGDGVKDLVVLHCCGDVQPTFLLGRGGGDLIRKSASSVVATPRAR